MIYLMPTGKDFVLSTMPDKTAEKMIKDGKCKADHIEVLGDCTKVEYEGNTYYFNVKLDVEVEEKPKKKAKKVEK